MKGLLLKDLYNLKRIGKQYLLILAFYTIWCVFMKNESMFSMMIILTSSMTVLTSLSFDEAAHFDKSLRRVHHPYYGYQPSSGPFPSG